MTPTVSLVKGRPGLGRDVRLERLWLAAQQKSWRSIAVVSSGPDVPTIEVAHTLARVAWWYAGDPTAVVDLRFLSLRLLNYQIEDIRRQIGSGDRLFVAVRSPSENPTAVPVARSVDAVILCVALGVTVVSAARKTIDAVGRERFLGTVLVQPQRQRQGVSEPPR
jgi:hypothetical protein